MKTMTFKNLVAGLIGGLAITGTASAQAPAAKAAGTVPAPSVATAMPAPDAMLMMIRVHVLAVGQANAANDYEVLRALGSTNFRELNTTEALSKTFTSLRDVNLDLSPVAVTTPVLTEAPQITDGKLRVIGAFPTVPVEVPFGMLFEQDRGLWKLAAISVGARPAAQVTPVKMPMTAPKAAPGSMAPLKAR
jgi:hypothetical protein